MAKLKGLPTSISNNKGFTITEVLVAMVILIMIILAFETLFTTSYSGIFSAGYKNKALITAQSTIETAISSSSGGNDLMPPIYFPEPNITLNQIKGQIIEINQPYKDANGNQMINKLTTFVPNN